MNGLARKTSASGRKWDSSKCEQRPFESLVRDVRAKNEREQRKVLVTGAAGFIGSHVAEFCANKLGFVTVAADDLSGGFKRNIPEGVQFVQVDLQDSAAVEELFKTHGPFDYVYHLAAYAAEGLSHFIRNFNYQNNLVASVNIVNNAVRSRTVKCVVFTSSIAAFGSQEVLPYREEMTQKPEDPYGISKHAFELDLLTMKEMFGIDFVSFYPHNVYGPRQNIADKFRNAVGIFMNQILHDQPMTIFGSGNQTRGFSYISDVAPLIGMGPELPRARNENFFVGTDDYTSVYNLSVLTAAAMGVPHNVNLLAARHEVIDAYASHDKLRCFFNPPKPTPLREGLKTTADYVNRLGKFEPTGFQKIEVWDHMPDSWVKALNSWKERSSTGKSGSAKRGSPEHA